MKLSGTALRGVLAAYGLSAKDFADSVGEPQARVAKLLSQSGSLPKDFEFKARSALLEERTRRRRADGVEVCDWRRDTPHPPRGARTSEYEQYFRALSEHSCAECDAVKVWEQAHPDPMAAYAQSPTEILGLALGASRGSRHLPLFLGLVVGLAIGGRQLGPMISSADDASRVGGVVGFSLGVAALLGWLVIRSGLTRDPGSNPVPRTTEEAVEAAQRELDREGMKTSLKIVLSGLVLVLAVNLTPERWSAQLSIGGMATTAAVVLACVGCWDIFRQSLVQRWPTVRADVTASTILEEDKNGRFVPAVFREYEFGGQLYSGWRLHPKGPISGREKAQESAKSFARGDAIHIYVNPHDPIHSYVDRSLKLDVAVGLLVVAVVVGILGAIYG